MQAGAQHLRQDHVRQHRRQHSHEQRGEHCTQYSEKAATVLLLVESVYIMRKDADHGQATNGFGQKI